MTSNARIRQNAALPLGPLALIALGLAGLIVNFGFFSWGRLFSLLQLWPLVLVAIGLDRLLGGRYRLAVIITTLVSGGVLYSFFTNFTAALPSRSEPIAQPLAGARAAQLRLRSGVNALQLRGAPLGELLVEGEVDVRRGELLQTHFELEGALARYTLASISQGQNFRIDERERRWQLAVNTALPLVLELETELGSHLLDLAELTLNHLALRSGSGEVLLRLPATQSYRAQLETGTGSVTVELPAELGVRLRVGSGVSALALEGEFRQVGAVYLSENFETAAAQLELTVDGMAPLTVRYR